MKSVIKLYVLGLFLAGVSFSSCKKHEYYQTNPNNPSTGTTALLLTNILTNTFNVGPFSSSFADRHLTFYERPDVNVNYGWGASSYNSYNMLRQVKDMDEKAAVSGEQNYRGLAKFFRAVYFLQLTETFGDVPYSEAMKALESVPTPKYDSQKEVYVGILAELEEANNLLDPAKGNVAGDIVYGENVGSQITQWKQLVNAFTLRVLIHLSKKEADADLNIKAKFQNILSNATKYPLMTGNADNGQLKYNTSAINNAYPTFQSLSAQTSISMEKGFVDILKARNDPRLFEMAEPISGQPSGIFASYDGVNAGLTVSTQQSNSAAASRIKSRYWNDAVNEPLIFLSYVEQEFLIAEAIARSWVTGAGTAAAHYENGIKASMKFYGISDGSITSYLAQPLVAYNPANSIQMIVIQKYISFFMNSGWEAFFEQRRTGFPSLNVGAGTSNGGMVPKRWRYPQSEFTLNETNVKDAVQRQFGGDDNTNGTLWVLQ